MNPCDRESPFPANVIVIIMACTDHVSQCIFYPPSLGFKKSYTTYTFQGSGLNFFMTVGKQIPVGIREFCSVTGPGRRIYARSCEMKSREAIQRLESKTF